METPFMEEIPQTELLRLYEQTYAGNGGEYRTSRQLIENELARRAAKIADIGVVDMPVADPAEYLCPIDPQEALNCESCQ